MSIYYRVTNIGIKYFILAAVMLIMACSEAEEPIQQDGTPIVFTQNLSTATTRANTNYFVDGRNQLTIPNGKQIGMFGYYHGNNSWSNVSGNHVANLFYNEPMTSVVAEDLSTTFNYNGIRFWPSTSDEMCSFIAYYPYSANNSGTNGITINPDYVGDNTNIGKIHYAGSSNAGGQIDFMVTELAADRTKLTNNARVGLNFKHMLAALQIKLGSIEAGLSIDNLVRIELPNMYTEGDCNIDYSAEKTTFAWDNKTNQQKLTMSKAEFENDPSFLIITQTLTEVIAVFDVNASEATRSYTLNKELNRGVKYTYTLGTPTASDDLDVIALWKDHRPNGDSTPEYAASNDVAGHPFGKDNKGEDIVITPGSTKMRIYYYNPNPLEYFVIRLWNGADIAELIGFIQPTTSTDEGYLSVTPQPRPNGDPDDHSIYVEFTITQEMLDKFNQVGTDGKCMRITQTNTTIMAIAFINHA